MEVGEAEKMTHGGGSTGSGAVSLDPPVSVADVAPVSSPAELESPAPPPDVVASVDDGDVSDAPPALDDEELSVAPGVNASNALSS
jgi:hypothetical protein